MTTLTLKVPARLNRRIARAARHKGQSTKCWVLAALEHEVERKERLLDYVKRARCRVPATVPIGEFESRMRARLRLEQFSAGKAVTRAQARRAG